MRVLVLEYVTGGGMAAMTPPPSLAREGDLMLRALVKDLAGVAGVEVVTTRDRRLGGMDLPVEVHEIGSETDPRALWQDLLHRVEAAWLVAPETGGELERLACLAEAAGCALLGSTPGAVALTASKRATAACLAQHGIPVVGDGFRRGRNGWVVKPDDGAGCDDTVFCASDEDLAAHLAATGKSGSLLVQPYLPGTAGSLSVLFQEGTAWVLACNRQHVAVRNGRLVYEGGIVGGMEGHRKDCEPLAEGIARAVPGLRGHAGIDFVMTGEGPVAIEVNPRPTTSYCRLAEAIGVNPAALALGLLDHPLEALRRPLQVRPVPIDLAACHA